MSKKKRKSPTPPPQILVLDPNREPQAEELSVEASTTHIVLQPEEPPPDDSANQLPPSPMDVNNPAGFKPNRVN